MFIESERLDTKVGKTRIDVITATHGFLYHDADEGRYIALQDGFRVEGKLGEDDYRLMRFARNDIKLPDSVGDDSEAAQKRSAPTATLLAASDDPLMNSELHWRLAAPLSVLVLGLLALPLSRSSPREPRYARMQTFDQSLFTLYQAGEISYEDALRHDDHVDAVEGRVEITGQDAAGDFRGVRQQRVRAAQADFRGAERAQPVHVGARDARVADVAADRHAQALDAFLVVADRQQVEQALGRVRAVAVARIEDRRAARVRGEPRRRTVLLVAHDERIGAHRLDRRERVLEGFALAGRGAGDVEVHDRRTEAARGELEARARARRRLEEQVDDGAPGEQRQRRRAGAELLAQRRGAVEQAFDAHGHR